MSLPTVILMTSNGVGMGHLSRQLTIALSGHSHFRSVIFSLSKALPRVMQAYRGGDLPEAEGLDIRYEYCPSRETGWLPEGGWQRWVRQKYLSYRWHPYLRDRLLALIAETDASAVVFDGAFPYRGLLEAKKRRPDVPFMWVRRGMWKSDVSPKQLEPIRDFDVVITPGDFGEAHDVGPSSSTPEVSISPVSLTNVLTPLDQKAARQALGLEPEGPALLLAPGSGALGSVEATANQVRQIISEVAPHWQVAVTKQSIATHRIEGSGVHLLNDVYPLARYLPAFDAAVSAAGYNSVHELLSSRIPTLFIPSVSHATDDQRSRAEGVAARGAALVSGTNLTGSSESSELPDLHTVMKKLLDSNSRAEIRGACAELAKANGGTQAADLISSHIDQSRVVPSLPNLPTPPRPLIDARTRVPKLLVTETPTPESMVGAIPVEHLLPGSSPEYKQTRRNTARWIYRFD